MTAAVEKLAKAAWRLAPPPIERKLRTEAGSRFLRFVPVSLAAVVTSQVVLVILTGPFTRYIGGFTAGVIASMVAAGVSYLLSRWAWERKGRPDVLRETLPFWAVSIACWLILGLTTHYANTWAVHMQLHHIERHVVVNGAYLLVNCLTFISRFLIFHYALFTNRGLPVDVVSATPSQTPPGVQAAPGMHAAPVTVADDAPAKPKVRS